VSRGGLSSKNARQPLGLDMTSEECLELFREIEHRNSERLAHLHREDDPLVLRQRWGDSPGRLETGRIGFRR
jgi:hypothetical protein